MVYTEQCKRTFWWKIYVGKKYFDSEESALKLFVVVPTEGLQVLHSSVQRDEKHANISYDTSALEWN